MSSSISGIRRFASNSRTAFFFSSDMVQPSGLLKLEDSRHALTDGAPSALRRAARSTPLLASVGNSSTLRSRAWSTCRNPKYVGDSMAIVSPGRATTFRASTRASVQPHVMAMSSGESACPQRSARRAISRRNRGSPLGTVYVLYSPPSTRAARARKRSSRPAARSSASGIAQPNGTRSGSAAYSRSFGMTPETATVVGLPDGFEIAGVSRRTGAPFAT